MEKGPWDTDVMQGIICVLQKNTVIPLKKGCFCPLPKQYNVESQAKLQVLVFKIVRVVGGKTM